MSRKNLRSRAVFAAVISLSSASVLVPVSGVGADDCTLPGEGTTDFPYFIRTADDLALLAGDDPTCDLDQEYLVVDDITVGADWPGIGPRTGTGFTGIFDGGGRTITIGSEEEPAEIGLFDVILGGIVVDTVVEIDLLAEFGADVRDVIIIGGLAGGSALDAEVVTSSVSGAIWVEVTTEAEVAVGGLIGSAADTLIGETVADVEIYFELEESDRPDPFELDESDGSDPMVDERAPSPIAAIGGLVGYAGGEMLVVSSYTSGDIVAADEEVALGGLIGMLGISLATSLGVDEAAIAPRTDEIAEETAIINTYSATTLIAADDSFSVGGFIGILLDPDDVLLDDNFWSSEVSGIDVGVTDGSNPIDPVAGLTNVTIDELTDFATFDGADWEIVDGWAPSSSLTDPDFLPEFVWGICDGVNFGTPYLIWEHPEDPCTYLALAPERFMDTRPGTPTPANPAAHATGPIAAGETYELEITGYGDVPFDAGAVSVTLTVVGADADGFATVWPCDEDRPETSNVNFVGVGTIANTVISGLDSFGQICIYLGQASANVLVDVNGYFPLGSDYVTLDQPERLMDTREGTPVTLDPDAHATGPLQPGEEFELTVAGLGDIPDLGVASVVLNVTAVEAQGQGYLTVWPCGEPRPETSNLNFVGVTTIANAVIANLGGGRVCLATEQVATDVIVDVAGYFADGSAYHGVEPTRVFDSRQADDARALRATDGGEKIEPGRQIVISPAANDSGVPLAAQAAMLNVTIVGADGAGFATVWPCGEPQPETSNVNFVGVTTIAAGTITGVGNETEPGQVCIVLGQVAAHVVVDVNGYFD